MVRQIRNLHALMYSSLSDPTLTQEDIKQILDSARRYNEQHEITGLLLFQEGSFLQVLEGDRRQISLLFEKKLMRDPRHYSVSLFHDRPLVERQFRYWHLAFSDLDKQTAKLSLPYREFLRGERGLYELTSNTSRALELVGQIHRRVLCREKTVITHNCEVSTEKH